jgi:ATP-dependent Clp protease adaptor protein ClpS
MFSNLPNITHYEKPLWEEDVDVLVDDEIDSGFTAQLIVFNDDVNSFEWVIECFMQVLGHSSEQAEQLSLIIHYKGKATVKSGSRSELIPYCEALLERGLSAEVVSESSDD